MRLQAGEQPNGGGGGARGRPLTWHASAAAPPLDKRMNQLATGLRMYASHSNQPRVAA
jgi:hypothetical protein